jgi:hypothetical protein
MSQGAALTLDNRARQQHLPAPKPTNSLPHRCSCAHAARHLRRGTLLAARAARRRGRGWGLHPRGAAAGAGGSSVVPQAAAGQGRPRALRPSSPHLPPLLLLPPPHALLLSPPPLTVLHSVTLTLIAPLPPPLPSPSSLHTLSPSPPPPRPSLRSLISSSIPMRVPLHPAGAAKERAAAKANAGLDLLGAPQRFAGAAEAAEEAGGAEKATGHGGNSGGHGLNGGFGGSVDGGGRGGVEDDGSVRGSWRGRQ